MSERQQRLIVVCGLGGTGKTTLADSLSRTLGIACLHKDAVKAALHDVGITTPRSYEILLALAEQQLANGVDLIVEATFHGPDAADVLRSWQQQYDLELVCVICSVDADVRRERISSRARHPAHLDADRRQLQHLDLTADYTAMPGRHIPVATDGPQAASAASVLAQLS